MLCERTEDSTMNNTVGNMKRSLLCVVTGYCAKRCCGNNSITLIDGSRYATNSDPHEWVMRRHMPRCFITRRRSDTDDTINHVLSSWSRLFSYFDRPHSSYHYCRTRFLISCCLPYKRLIFFFLRHMLFLQIIVFGKVVYECRSKGNTCNYRSSSSVLCLRK